MKITHPDFDVLDDSENYNTGQIIAQYPSTADLKSKGLDSRGFRKLVKNIINNQKYIIEDFLPTSILNQENLITLKEGLKNIHFPTDNDKLKNAIYRLKFNEHFFIQLLMALKRKKEKGCLISKQRRLFKKNL